MTLADVLKKIEDQLAWRGPSGRTQGHIVLTREEAEYLHRVVFEPDALLYEKDANAAG
jgi:hypothetical protein